MKKLFLIILLMSGCAWTLRHLVPACSDNPCQDVCGCKWCLPGAPGENGCPPVPLQP